MAGRDGTSSTESVEHIHLAGHVLDYTLRRSTRARGLRLTVDPRRGLVVSMPPPTRRGWASPNGRLEGFLRERESWILRHLARLEREWAEVEALGGVRDGGRITYLGVGHRIRVVLGPAGTRRTRVERVGADEGDELVVTPKPRERRSVARILEIWLRERAAEAIARSVAVHAAALGVTPTSVVLRDPRTRWGSASREGRLMLSWRLILAPPGSLETVVVHELAHLRVMGHGPGFWRLVARLRPDHRSDRAWLRRNSHVVHGALSD